MIFYKTSEIQILYMSIILGFFLGLIWEFFRFLRHAGTRKRILVFIEDFIFSIICGVIVLLFTYCVNYLVFRWYEALGIILGFILYLLTLGRLLTKFSEAIIKTILKIIRFIYINILYPVYILLDKFFKTVKINIERLKSQRHERFIIAYAAKGFENKKKGFDKREQHSTKQN